MMIHDITEQAGRNRTRKRVGRGRGSGVGKTSGRGHKGAKSRSGYSRRPGFEGGQVAFFRRIPKRGFTNHAFRNLYHVVNLKLLEERFESGDEVTAESLKKVGLIRDTKLPVKILGEGDLTKKLTVEATRFSASAREKITGAGGEVRELTPAKWTRAVAGPSRITLRKRRGPQKVKGAKGN